MKKGDTVTIYADPLTKRNVEGKAILQKRLDNDDEFYEGDSIQRWQVKFIDNGFITERTIRVSEENVSAY